MRTLLRAAVVATLAAGVVGVWRQRREVVEARRSGRAAPRPVGLAGDGGLDPLARHLSTWVPERPAGPGAVIAASVWAAPLTAVGLIVGLASGGRPRWSTEHSCLVFEGAGGLPGRILEGIGARANAIGQVVVVRGSAADPRLLAHEAVHVRQAERLGPLLFPMYLWFAARYGYRNHPLERAARLGARVSADRA